MFMRLLSGVCVALLLLPALDGCAYVKHAQSEGRAEVNAVFLQTFRENFLKACAESWGRTATKACTCVETRLEKSHDLDELLRLSEDEAAESKAIGAALPACDPKGLVGGAAK
jgi:hypothetical protein